MVKGASKLNEIIARYKKEVALLGVHVTEVFLYGSYARGTYCKESDIDLIVVSPDFAKLNTRERLEVLGIAAARILEPIQAYGLTPEEIDQHAVAPFWADILEKEAIPISV